MHGNVYEWVQDWYGGYTAETAEDPQGLSSGAGRVIRGGHWYSGAGHCRSADRNSATPGSRDDVIGFRVLRRVE
jgi:formylglycine-generating enzyme required for sulfatase activity